MRSKTTIACGDCLVEIPKLLEPGSVDLVLMDPPYCNNNKSRLGNRYNQSEGQLTFYDDMSPRVFFRFMEARLLECWKAMRPGAHLYVFSGGDYIREMMDAVEQGSFRLNKLLVWDKVTIGGGYAWRGQHEFIIFGSKGVADPVQDKSLPSVLAHKRVPKSKKLHPFEKPLPLLSDLIRNSTEEGATVLDPFMGSGSTLEAAYLLRRDVYGIELSEEHCQSARDRLAKHQFPWEEDPP